MQRGEVISLLISALLHAGIFISGDSLFFSHASFESPHNSANQIVINVSFYAEESVPNKEHEKEQARIIPKEVEKAEVSLDRKVIKKKIEPAKEIVSKSSTNGIKTEQDSGKEPQVSNSGTTQASPNYKSNPAPEYPESARRMRKEGLVHLHVLVDSAGRAKDVKVKTSSGSTVLDDAAIAAVLKWQFQPGKLAGVAVESMVDVPVRFQLKNE